MPDNTPPIERRHLVLIAAAVGAVCGENARILGIAPAGQPRADAWTRSGRATIHNSHRPGRRSGIERAVAKAHPGATTS